MVDPVAGGSVINRATPSSLNLIACSGKAARLSIFTIQEIKNIIFVYFTFLLFLKEKIVFFFLRGSECNYTKVEECKSKKVQLS